MTTTIYILPPLLLDSTFSAMFDQHPGHGSMSIEVNSGSNLYISHRPSNEASKLTELKESLDQGGKKYLTSDYVEAAEPYKSFEEEKMAREKQDDGNKQPVKEIRILNLDENAMIEEYYSSLKRKKYHRYHIVHRNCATVIKDILKVGLKCRDRKFLLFNTCYVESHIETIDALYWTPNLIRELAYRVMFSIC